jgi:hypothetical protein
MCKEKGILLIHIYEHDWAIKRGACERLILGKIGKADRTLDARKLRVGPAEDCAAFVSSYHFQGNVASEVQYGLFLGETMVAAMTFGKTRYNKNYKWELLRLCTITGTRVRGGASRLFAKFKQEHLQSGDTVISYARLDYSVGGVYAALGFSFDGVCAPDYRWIKQPNVSLSRHATQKHRLSRLLGDKFDASKSETQNMKDSGYKRVYSAGNLRYVYSHE